MGIRSVLSKPLAKWVVAQQAKWMARPEHFQTLIFKAIIKEAKDTQFGKDHGFSDISTYEDFKNQVPIRDYEGLKSYFDDTAEGKPNILWPGKPAYFAKTSGTTSGTKYIPITKASLPNHINSARNALLNYVHESGRGDFLDGKLIFLSGSPVLDVKGGVPTGRLSGIVNHHIPSYLRTNQMPSYATNCIDDWEQKVDKIVEETLHQNMTLISGIPPWVQMYFDRIQAKTGKKIKEVFPDFPLFVYGGVNFSPYRDKLFDSIGRKIDSIETYPASEGFIAFQDSQHEEGLLLLAHSGIFFEFIPSEQFFEENPPRYALEDVHVGVNYVIILSSNAGLWGYNIGDTVRFVSTYPHRLVVTGRIKHFISAFGEHVIGEEVEKSLQEGLLAYPGTEIIEFTVAPQVQPTGSDLPYHEWFIEFSKPPADFLGFAKVVDEALQKTNAYYKDLITGKILQTLKIRPLKREAFREYMKTQGKLGGQNKVPRLSNDRKIAGGLENFLA
jgi:hypothetical protein